MFQCSSCCVRLFHDRITLQRLAPPTESKQPFRHPQKIDRLSDAEQRSNDQHSTGGSLEEPGYPIDLVSFPARKGLFQGNEVSKKHNLVLASRSWSKTNHNQTLPQCNFSAGYAEKKLLFSPNKTRWSWLVASNVTLTECSHQCLQNELLLWLSWASGVWFWWLQGKGLLL